MKPLRHDSGSVSGRVSHIIEQVPIWTNRRPRGPLGTVGRQLPTRRSSSDEWDKSNTGSPRGTGRGPEESPPSIRCESLGQPREPADQHDADRHQSIAAREARRDRRIRRSEFPCNTPRICRIRKSAQIAAYALYHVSHKKSPDAL